MLEGSRVRLEVFSPDLRTPVIQPVTAAISDSRPEFDNVATTENGGGGGRVIHARIDIDGALVRYESLESNSFAGVWADGFNGYSLTFTALSRGAMRLNAVDLLKDLTNFRLDSSHDRDRALINVEGLSIGNGDEFALRLGFRIAGGKRADVLEGYAGRDLLIGNGGDDILLGRGGDRIVGGGGSDRLFGGAGAIVFGPHTGKDRIMDFQDGLDLLNFRGADDFADIQIVDRPNGALVSWGTAASVLLVGVDADRIDPADFLF